MGSKNKLRRFRENETFDNVFQPSRSQLVDEVYEHKGNWNKNVFKNNNPLVLELGCGKGEYSVALGKKYPNKNFIGIDIKGARFWRGAKTATEDKMPNVAFIRTQIELVESVFAENEVDEIWITFPDPQIKYKRTKHRMTNSAFLKRYKNILKPDGIMNLKRTPSLCIGTPLDYCMEKATRCYMLIMMCTDKKEARKKLRTSKHITRASIWNKASQLRIFGSKLTNY